MSIKRSSSTRTPVRRASDDGGSLTKLDRQSLFDELQRRGQAGEPFTIAELAQALSAGELAITKAVLFLAADGYLGHADGGRYHAAPMAQADPDEFSRCLTAAAKNPLREKDLSEIARLRQNNDIMRERLLKATAERDRLAGERDRLLALLQGAGIDPTPPG